MARAPTPVEMTDPLKGLGGPKLGRSTPGPVNYGGTRVFTMLEQLESDWECANAELQHAMPALNMARCAVAETSAGSAENAAARKREAELLREIRPKFKNAQRVKAALAAGQKAQKSLSSVPTFGRKNDTFARPLTGASDTPSDCAHRNL
eukprot:SAG31_NODE_332_length_17516_cov_3.552840_9_plen_150_part_00